jgi:hypothetical protein
MTDVTIASIKVANPMGWSHENLLVDCEEPCKEDPAVLN